MCNFVAEGDSIDINGVPGGKKYIGKLSDTARIVYSVLETAPYNYHGEFHCHEMHGHGT